MAVIARRKREMQELHPNEFRRKMVVTEDLIKKMRHTFTLHGHDGCVNTLNWNESGTLLASGSDDQCVFVWQENGRLLRKLITNHTNNIFSVLFVPNARDRLVLSAAGDYKIFLHDLEQGDQGANIQSWECNNRVKKLAICNTLPRLFWSASEDGLVKQFDLRDNRSENLIDLSSKHQLKSLAINEAFPEMLALGLNDSEVPIYDRRYLNEPVMKLLPAHLSFTTDRRMFRSALVTHLAFNKRGDELIVNIGSENIYIFNVRDRGHHNPKVFGALKSFLNEDPNFSIPSDDHSNASAFSIEDVSPKRREFSRIIDKCSVKLSTFGKRNSLPPPFTPADLKFESRSRRYDSSFVQCLMTRGGSLLERNWEGDFMAALRDFLHALRINPGNKKAHLKLVEALMCLRQWHLGNECLALYNNLYPGDEEVKPLAKKLEDKEDDQAAETLPWTEERAKIFCDYVDRLTGHFNVNTDIKEANWFGGEDQYIVAGSDCSNMFVWERSSQKVVRLFKADQYTVNCVQPHPSRCLIASSGIDSVVRFWEPASTALKQFTEKDHPEEVDDRDMTDKIYDVMKKNRKQMLPESVWENLFTTMGIELMAAPPSGRGDGPQDEAQAEGQSAIRCRTM